jgi:hypothetical protein
MNFDLLIIPPFSPLKINFFPTKINFFSSLKINFFSDKNYFFFQTKIKFKKILRAFSNGTKDKKMPAGSGLANPGLVAIWAES